MYRNYRLTGLILVVIGLSCSKPPGNYNSLTPEEYEVIVNKGTEPKFSGKYNDFKEEGTFTCKRCSEPLFSSKDKFDSKTGWPSFDDILPGKVSLKNPESIYTEITCTKCDAHLGHLKKGEKFTPKDKRYCVNSLSLNFRK